MEHWNSQTKMWKSRCTRKKILNVKRTDSWKNQCSRDIVDQTPAKKILSHSKTKTKSTESNNIFWWNCKAQWVTCQLRCTKRNQVPCPTTWDRKFCQAVHHQNSWTELSSWSFTYAVTNKNQVSGIARTSC